MEAASNPISSWTGHTQKRATELITNWPRRCRWFALCNEFRAIAKNVGDILTRPDLCKRMAKILKISAGEIEDSLMDSTRQYLVGDLQRPERLRHIASSLVEIGITRYGEDGGTEPPHTHTHAFE